MQDPNEIAVGDIVRAKDGTEPLRVTAVNDNGTLNVEPVPAEELAPKYFPNRKQRRAYAAQLRRFLKKQAKQQR